MRKLLTLLLLASIGGSNAQNPEERGNHYEGDMVDFNPAMYHSRAGVINLNLRWPDKTVVYAFNPNYPSDLRQMFRDAMFQISSRTCIRFRERTTETDYVFVQEGNGCSSNIGRIGGRQVTSLHRDCKILGTFIHEILHVLGFHHEQSRTDRDDFVTVNWNNIQTGAQGNFNKFGIDLISPFGTPYDYDSVMHYSRYAFSRNSRATLTPRVASANIGQRLGLSSYDVKKVNNMYCSTRSPEDSHLETTTTSPSTTTTVRPPQAPNVEVYAP